ncbi:MAG TPA: hypothetical protein VGF75_00695 [Candidatus Saccharimonadales bacterium]
MLYEKLKSKRKADPGVRQEEEPGSTSIISIRPGTDEKLDNGRDVATMVDIRLTGAEIVSGQEIAGQLATLFKGYGEVTVYQPIDITPELHQSLMQDPPDCVEGFCARLGVSRPEAPFVTFLMIKTEY